MSNNLSSDDASELLQNRIRFKLYAAEQHLHNLHTLEQNDNNGMLTFERRVPREIEIECFLFNIIGVIDSLLAQINEKLILGINAKEIDLGRVNRELKSRGKSALLSDLNKFLAPATPISPAGWIWILNDLRNQSTHRNLINIKVTQRITDNANNGTSISDRPKVFFVSNPNQNLEIIQFLEDSLQHMKDLVENMKNNEPLLN